MDIIYYLGATCLVLFMLLATYDGLYLHLWKYELFKQEESIFEHKTHAARAILFPLIIWLVFVNSDRMSFYLGVLFIVIDIIVLAIDAYSEKESRAFMNGLPRWEYILHLMSNGFHFAAIALMLVTRLALSDTGVMVISQFEPSAGKTVMDFIAENIIPGAIVMALLHVVLLFPGGIKLWDKIRRKKAKPAKS